VLRAPFPWFGGKSRVSHLVWERFGDVRNYVEPFFGSGAVLLGRPHEPRVETINDKDCYLANFWRAVQHDPEQVARFADSPVNEADLHARHRWLVETAVDRVTRVMEDPEFFDPKAAGWWVWGQCLWIGSGWCLPVGERHSNGTRTTTDWAVRPDLSSANGRGGISRAQKLRADRSGGRAGVLSDTVQESGTARKRPALTRKREGGVGVHRLSLTDKKRPALSQGGGRGITKQIPDLAGDSGAVGRGIHASGFVKTVGLYEYMAALSHRLRRVRVCCGDWKRVVGPAVTTCISTTGLFLDPPYHAPGTQRSKVYNHDDDAIWNEVRDWAIANGDNPELRIALCGYEGDHAIPATWSEVAWKAAGGYGSSQRGRANRDRERIWFSPHCLPATADQHSLDLNPEAA
jgi:hypothetical protein